MKIDRYYNLTGSEVFAMFGEDVSTLRSTRLVRGEFTTAEISYDRMLGRFSVVVWCGS